jgi:hypothetical protein
VTSAPQFDGLDYPPDFVVDPPPHLVWRKARLEVDSREETARANDSDFAQRARYTLDKLGRELGAAVTGGRNDLLNKHAHTMGGFVGAGAITRAEVEAALTAACHRNGLIAEGASAVAATMKSGLDTGIANRFSEEPAQPSDDDENAPDLFTLESNLEDLTRPPGLVGKIIDWCEATTERPSRAAALGAALGFVATLVGRHFASESDARTNLYLVTLAESGFGKDHARQAIKRLATAAGVGWALGPGRVMSTTALRNKLLQHPSSLYMIDEFHGTVAMVTDKRSPYARLLGDDLLELFSAASTVFLGAEYASTPAVDIHNPNLSIYGTSTPDAFWSAAGSAAVSNGLLARFILLDINTSKPARRQPSADIRKVPTELIRACQSLVQAHGGNIALDGSRPIAAKSVRADADAARLLDDFKDRIEAKELSADGRQKPFLNRAVEHAIKLALTVAVGTDPKRPVIDGLAMEWACKLAWHSTCSLIEETRDRIGDSQREADYNAIMKLIKSAGPDGLKPSVIPDRTRGMDARRRDELLNDMKASGRVRFGAVQTKRGTRDRWVFVR